MGGFGNRHPAAPVGCSGGGLQRDDSDPLVSATELEPNRPIGEIFGFVSTVSYKALHKPFQIDEIHFPSGNDHAKLGFAPKLVRGAPCTLSSSKTIS
jgi:hypothetical protein